MSINNVYFPTWHNGFEKELSKVPSYITHITLSFLRPEAVFIDLNESMDTVFYDGKITLKELKYIICECRVHGGKDRVILASTGGEIAGNFLNVNYDSLVNVVEELGLDGIDIDYEPNGVMAETDEEILKYTELISGFRRCFDAKTKETGKKYLISCAPTGIGLFNDDCFPLIETKYKHVIERLKTIIPISEQDEELKIGEITDDNILKLPKLNVGSVGSSFNFTSAGKMDLVFKTKCDKEFKDRYKYIGQMVDIVFYQAYNIGSCNILARILCYEKHRELSEFFNEENRSSGFIIGHGSHVGKEAWAHFSFTKKRLSYIYSYIKQYGRNCDGASFWSYFASFVDDTKNVPYYGMGFKNRSEIFKLTSQLLGIVK
ncbi:MAG: glycosyl hydrolase family 18 protein [Spirochaetaceae bacterium]